MLTPFQVLSQLMAGKFAVMWKDGNPVEIRCPHCREFWTWPAHRPVDPADLDGVIEHWSKCRARLAKQERKTQTSRAKQLKGK